MVKSDPSISTATPPTSPDALRMQAKGSQGKHKSWEDGTSFACQPDGPCAACGPPSVRGRPLTTKPFRRFAALLLLCLPLSISKTCPNMCGKQKVTVSFGRGAKSRASYHVSVFFELVSLSGLIDRYSRTRQPLETLRSL